MNFTQEAGGECMLILPGGGRGKAYMYVDFTGGQGESACKFLTAGKGECL